LALNPFRLSGSNWFVQLKPYARIARDREENKPPSNSKITKNNRSFWGIGPSVGFEKFTPVSLKWQRNFGIYLSASHEIFNVTSRQTFGTGTLELKDKFSTEQAQLKTYFEMGYYPNNRTTLNASLSFTGGYNTYNPNLSLIKYTIVLNPEMSFRTLYFINYRTFLDANFAIWYNSGRTKQLTGGDLKNHDFNTNFSLGLSHTIL
jgi:hypothetical protein